VHAERRPSDPYTGMSKPSPSTASLSSSKLIRGTPSDDEDLSPSDDDFTQFTLEDNLKRLTLDPIHPHQRFFGKSSGVMLAQTALDYKNVYTGGDEKLICLPNKRPEFWNVRPVCEHLVCLPLSCCALIRVS
jgi:hypothetical protein